MKPGPLNLPIIWRGCEWQAIPMKWKNQDGTPFNLAGWTPLAMTRSGISLNPVVTDEEGGITSISLTRTQTESMKLGVEQWDWVWWDTVNDIVYPPTLSGTILVDQPTTRDLPVLVVP